MKKLNTTELKRIQLKILQRVDEYCEQNNIHYFLMYGSLIGAIRHKGIIPWDDDIDICMNRKDYDNFIENFSSDMTDSFYVRSQKTDITFPFYYSKVCIRDTHAFEPIDKQDYDVGINIDLFPLDSVPDGLIKRVKQQIIVKICKIKLIPHTIDFGIKRSACKRIILSFLSLMYRKPAYYYIQQIERIIDTHNDNTTFITEIMTPYGKRAVFPRVWFSKTIKVPFEGMMIPVPYEYHKILTRIYGDYMSPPQIDQQVSHHSCKAFSDCDLD